ncbi:tetratricopeptide repeat protein [Fodinibius sp. AD559]|uniref:tetratricopeptide repeat protein n=1 Tax=Fodinibius sp. AD559 TaxID=3424179 RepID=UPI004046A406
MDRENWKNIEEIIDTALTMDQSQRKTYIEENCKGSSELKRQAIKMLENIEQAKASNYLEDDKQYLEFEAYFPNSNKPAGRSLIGNEIDVYKITGLIGHGGMGSVYTAKRSDELYEKQVAIKILHRGMDTPSNIARFRREQQILAKLNHPNIAQLLDGGVTEDGLPYLVMEYVDGIPLHDYCDTHQLNLDKRIELFKSVCRAVRHAHSNTVIHRDLKPSNILVTEDGTAKVLDFGIAKLLEPEDPETTVFKTRTGSRIFTLAFAAPEQIEGTNVTTATDTYGLGLLLYELLAGIHPFGLEDKNLSEIENLIVNQTPNRPSARLESLPSKKQEHIAQKHNTTPSSLIKLLKGDLDAIIMKALRKEPEARYRSAEQLLEDLNRREQNLPVIAREDTVRYNISKFVRRHKTGISVAVGFLLLITGFAGFYTWRIAHERDQAHFEAERAEQVKEFMLGIFDETNPELAGGAIKDLSAKQLLSSGIEKVEQELSDQPEMYVELMASIGRALTNLDAFDEGEEVLNKALEKSAEFYGQNSLKTANIYGNLAVLKNSARDPSMATSYIKKAIAIIEEQPGSNEQDLANKYSTFGFSKALQSKYDTARTLFLKAENLYVASGNGNTVSRFTNSEDLAEVQVRLDEYDLAEKNLTNALDFFKNHYAGPHDNNIAEAKSTLGDLYHRMGAYKKADSLLQQALELKKELLGPENSTIASTHQTLALNYRLLGNYDNAFHHIKKAIEINKKIHGEQSYTYAQSITNLALFHSETKNYDQALSMFERSIEIKETILDKNHTSLAIAYYNYADILKKIGRLQKAKTLFEKALEIDKINYGTNHSDIAIDLNKLASVLTKMGNYSKADSLFKQAQRIYSETLPKDHYRIAESLVEHAKLHIRYRNYLKAESKLLEAIKIYQANFDTQDERIKEAKSLLKECRSKMDTNG